MTEREDRRVVTFPVLKTKQPIGEFYIGRLNSTVLCDITEFDIRHLVRENEIDSYLGIQRRLDPKRVREIAEYVRTGDACFPTAVILAVRDSCAEYDAETGLLTLSNVPNPDEDEDAVLFKDIARVLDGQHRIEGLRGLNDGFEVNVCIFVGLDIAEQAYIFATVNLAQTKVNPSLVYDLFDFAKLRSPQKVCHNIAVALDSTEGSPFFQRIKRLGVATDGRFGETLTQATVVESLMPYVSRDPRSDRETYRKGELPKRADAKDSQILIFRNMMIDQRDVAIADILWNYFDAVRGRWSEAWAYPGRGRMLNKTNGFKAFMKFMGDAYRSLATPGKSPYKVPTIEEFASILQRIGLSNDDFTTDNFKPGSSGQSALYRALKEQSGI